MRPQAPAVTGFCGPGFAGGDQSQSVSHRRKHGRAHTACRGARGPHPQARDEEEGREHARVLEVVLVSALVAASRVDRTRR